MKLPFVLLSLFVFGLVNPLSAHQQKEAYTNMLFNARTGYLEVTHRFYVHDAEHALVKALNKKADLSLDDASMFEFAEYVRESFKVKLGAEQELEFATVGHEIEGKYFWVYQEAPLDESINLLELNMTALQEIWPKQINHINVEKNGKVRSVRLSKDMKWQQIKLED